MTAFAVQVYFWPGEVLYSGVGLDSTWHHHHAVQIGISLGTPFRIHQDRNAPPVLYRGFIAPPNVPHQVGSADISSLFMWVEAESPLASALMTVYSPHRVSPLSNELYQQLISEPNLQLTCTTAREIVYRMYDYMGVRPFDINPIDVRLQSVIASIRQPRESADPLLTRTLATQVSLSPSRLRHLFREQVGVSIQQFMLWQKLLSAISATLDGASLTEAAHKAGFSDSAHLSRTFRQMFGIKPSDIFSNSHYVQVNACRS